MRAVVHTVIVSSPGGNLFGSVKHFPYSLRLIVIHKPLDTRFAVGIKKSYMVGIEAGIAETDHYTFSRIRR